MDSRLITLAIHTYDRAVELRKLLEGEGIEVTLNNVNLEKPTVSSGVRVRIHESDLAQALRIVENADIFGHDAQGTDDTTAQILVPVDFSPHSLNATSLAFAMASALKADVALLHSYIDPIMSGELQLTTALTFDATAKEAKRASSRDSVKQSALWDMRSFAAHLKTMIRLGTLLPAKFTTKVTEGVPEDNINEHVKAHHPLMVIMGTRGAGRKKAEMIGSVTAEVLDQCRTTVLALPETVHAEAEAVFSHILMFAALDQSDILAIDTLYRLSPCQHATVTLINVPDKKRLSWRRSADADASTLMQYCKDNFTRFTFELLNVEPENLASTLADIEQSASVTLVAIPNRRKNILSRLFSPSLARKIIFRSDIPLMSIPV